MHTTKSAADKNDVTSMFEVMDAISAVIRSSDEKLRNLLANTLDAYAEDYPEDFLWAIGAKAPTLLGNLMMAVDMSCRDHVCAACAAHTADDDEADMLEDGGAPTPAPDFISKEEDENPSGVLRVDHRKNNKDLMENIAATVKMFKGTTH